MDISNEENVLQFPWMVVFTWESRRFIVLVFGKDTKSLNAHKVLEEGNTQNGNKRPPQMY